MGIITANINFLSSLGITTSEQFMEAFGDMATFTEYCNDMGYSWTIDEKDNLILITPDGKEVDSYVQLEVTETPTITVTEGNTEYTIEATGDGEVKLYIDGVEVTNPIAIQRTSQSQEITITATAEEEGKVISETAEEEITIPALNATAAPDIDMITGDDSCHILATGDGTVKLYLEGTEVQNPYTVARGNSDQTLTFTATAQESGKQISDTTEEEFVIPALPITATPTINVTTGLASFEIEAVGYGTVLLYADGTAVSNPYTVNKTSTAQTIVFTATAQETHKQISATATQSVTIPAQEVTATPVITYDSLSYTVSVSGQGTVLAYVDGVQTQMPHTFTQTTSAVTYVVTATAQEQGKQISATATQNCLVPAQSVTATPTITYDNTTFTVDVSGNGTVLAYVDGVATQMPHTFTQGATDVTYVVTATAQEQGKQISATATQNCLVPAIKTATPTISYVENTNDVTVTATGNGTVLLYAGGTAVTNPDVVAKGQTAQTIVFTATAQEAGKAISDTATETITIPAAAPVQVPNYTKLSVLNNPGNDGNITIYIPAAVDSTKATSMSYSKDGTNWTDTTIDNTAQTITIPVSAGDDVYLKGVANRWAAYQSAGSAHDFTNISSTADFNVSGNIMSLLYGDNFENQTSFPASSYMNFTGLFFVDPQNATSHLISASQLELPATTLTSGCYAGMFGYCTSLTTAPTLPATTLANYCYGDLILHTPGMPAGYGYAPGMFGYCTSLTTAPTLPATTLANYCYAGMFKGCYSLTSAPTLPATTATEGCYAGMFQECTSLTTAPTLPATTLANYCYQNMFYGCTSLTTAPTLPATTLANYCYRSMFQECTSLTTAPTLPATTLANYCYLCMFYGCTALTTAPTLPATTLANYCYQNMFSGCTSLSAVTMLATSGFYKNTEYWLDNVNSTGTLTVSESVSPGYDPYFRAPANWTILPAATTVPTISYVENANDVTITASGNGTVSLYERIGNATYDRSNPWVVSKGATASTVTVFAHAKETGKRVSNNTSDETITIPAAVPQ